jgi:hypothetical protein
VQISAALQVSTEGHALIVMDKRGHFKGANLLVWVETWKYYLVAQVLNTDIKT